MRKATLVCVSLAALWTVLLIIGAATVPVYSGSSTTVTSDGGRRTMSTSATALQINGRWVLVLLSVPAVTVLLTAGLVALQPRHRWASRAAWVPVGVVGVLAVLGMLTIGIFLLPVVVLLGIAVLIATLDRSASAQPPPPGLPSTTWPR